MTEAGLYLHIPFCQRRCNYCDFFSCTNAELKDAFVDELCKEIVSCGKRFPSLIKTIFFGGGTPSLLSLNHLDKIFSAIHSSFSVSSDETTIEVNPNSSTLLSDYKSFGFDRISIGLQSLDNKLLKKIGRLHTAEEGMDCLTRAREIFENVSCDLMLGLSENQDVTGDAEKIAPFCTHISAYILTVAKNTPIKKMIAKKQFEPASEDSTVTQYNALTETCRKLGLYRYETSNFARLGREGKHNSNYWFMKPYIGVGPSAHSYINGIRYYNKENIKDYLQGKHSGNNEEIIERKHSLDAEKTETIMLSLRTAKGLDIHKFDQTFSTNFLADYKKGIDEMKNYIGLKQGRLYILPQYFAVQNSIIVSILTE